MNRNPYLVVMHSLLLAALLAVFVYLIAVGDGWRASCAMVALVCLWLVRDDLTRSQP